MKIDVRCQPIKTMEIGEEIWRTCMPAVRTYGEPIHRLEQVGGKQKKNSQTTTYEQGSDGKPSGAPTLLVRTSTTLQKKKLGFFSYPAALPTYFRVQVISCPSILGRLSRREGYARPSPLLAPAVHRDGSRMRRQPVRVGGYELQLRAAQALRMRQQLTLARASGRRPPSRP
jgi:hypothetical protein